MKVSPKHRRLLSAAVAVVSALLSALPGRAATWTPDPSMPDPKSHQRLYEIGREYLDKNFDPDADLIGANSKHPPNKKQHATRESAYYAYALLLTGDPADRELAQKVIKKVVQTQETNADGLTRGAFGWYWEDKPTDLNSAAFVGTALADIAYLDQQHPCLDPDVRQIVESAGKLAVLAVMHRDVDPGYTNIAFLTTALTAAGDKLWHMPVAAAFSEAKLDGIMKLADDSEFAEYLSPTYGAVDFDGAYCARKFAFSDAFAAKCDQAINHLWKQFSLSYHAPTCNIGGPYCRAYGDNMLEYVAGMKYIYFLGLGGNYPMQNTETDHDWDKGGLVCMCDLPIGARDELKVTPPALRQWDVVNTPPNPIRHLTQYREGNFILGTVDYQDEWKQKRHLVADWRTDDAAAPNGFKVGFCIDESNETISGFPPAHVHFYSHQEKTAAIVGLVSSGGVPKDPAGLNLVFPKDATASGGSGGEPFKVTCGSMTTYLYPITKSNATLEGKAADRTFNITRLWSTAEPIGSTQAMAYLAVFRPADQPAPAVSDLTLSSDEKGGFATAKLDGAEMRVTFDRESK